MFDGSDDSQESSQSGDDRLSNMDLKKISEAVRPQDLADQISSLDVEDMSMVPQSYLNYNVNWSTNDDYQDSTMVHLIPDTEPEKFGIDRQV